MRILSVATVFPNVSEPGLGLFVGARLKALGKFVDVKVVAPIAPFDYDNPSRRGLGPRSVPRRTTFGGLDVFHPAWVYPPGNSAIKGPLLAIQIEPLIRRLRQTYPFQLIDAQFTHPEGTGAQALARRFTCPYSITMRGNELEFVRSPAKRAKMQKALAGAVVVIAVSNQLRDLALDLGVSTERVCTIGNGIDPSIYRVWSEPPARNGRPLRILSAGRLISLKRFDRIIEALARLRETGNDVCLDIAGGADRSLPDCRRKLESLARARNVAKQVRFLDWKAPGDLARSMAQADIFCLASSREGWPNVVHEALACGCPVVATEAGEVRRLIPDEQSGIVIPIDDADSLLAALRDSLHRSWDRRAIAESASKRTWNTVASELADVFASVR